MKTSFFGRLLSALAVGSATTGIAVAQDSAGTLEAGTLEEVIVTAQKREQSVMEVPFSMQAITGEALSRASIRDLQQVMELVPGAIQTNENSLGRRQYSIRGVDQGFSDPTVSYYVDDAAYFPGDSKAGFVELEDGVGPAHKATARANMLEIFAVPQPDDGVERLQSVAGDAENS